MDEEENGRKKRQGAKCGMKEMAVNSAMCTCILRGLHNGRRRGYLGKSVEEKVVVVFCVGVERWAQ